MNYKKVIDFTQFQVSNYGQWQAIHECRHPAANMHCWQHFPQRQLNNGLYVNQHKTI